MAAEKKCCVQTCGLDTEILHKFPNPEKDINRFRTWMYKIGGDILSLDNIYKYRRVCHLHFESSYHTRSKMLSVNAIPTLHLPAFSREQPLTDVTNYTAPDKTESYPDAILSTSGAVDNKKRNISQVEAPQILRQVVPKAKNQRVLPEDSTHTADFIIFIDNLFDSLNGSFTNSHNRSGKDLLKNVTPYSRHNEIWLEGKNILRTMKFVTMKGKNGTVPSINNFIHTIENMELLRDKLFFDYNVGTIFVQLLYLLF